MQPYPAQIDAVKAAIKAGRGGICMPTGTGKSITMALILQALQVPALIVVPTLELKRQLKASFTNYFGSLANITIENIDSPALQQVGDYGVLIIDECHHSASRSYQQLNKKFWHNIYHRYFFTATFFRNDTEETLLFESIAGQVIYSLSYAKAVAGKYIVPVEGFYIEVPAQKTDAFTWAEVYKELVVNNTPRNMLICGLLARLYSAHKSTLCLVKEVAHGRILSEMTGLPFISGEDEDSRKYIRQFSDKKTMAVIATTGMLGEGVDTRACEYVIVAGLGKAKSQFMQQVGRAVRNFDGKESAKVVLIKDKSHKYTLRHYNSQAKILVEEYGIKPQKLELK